MPFDGSKELIDIRANIKKYVQDELIPLEKRENLTPETRFPKSLLQSIWKRSRELGFYGIHLPEDLGGKNLSLVELCLLKEDLALTDSVLFLHVLGEMGGPLRVGHIFQFATPEQKEAFFLPVIRGEKACCFAMTEKNAGSDATRIETRAVKQGNAYILNGRKHYITASPFADFAIVMAVTDPDQGVQGITAFLVDADTPGYQVEEVATYVLEKLDVNPKIIRSAESRAKIMQAAAQQAQVQQAQQGATQAQAQQLQSQAQENTEPEGQI